MTIAFVFLTFCVIALLSLNAQSSFRSAVQACSDGEIEKSDFRLYTAFLAVSTVGMYAGFVAMLIFMGSNQ